MNLKSIRKERGLTQKEAARLLNIPLRTFVRYEEDSAYMKSYKYNMILNTLIEKTKIDESNGILSIESIKDKLIPILKKHKINRCYLFGSYAKGCPKETSDVDLLVDTDLTGLDFFDLVELIRKTLNKKIDLLRIKDIKSDNPISLEILKVGIRII